MMKDCGPSLVSWAKQWLGQEMFKNPFLARWELHLLEACWFGSKWETSVWEPQKRILLVIHILLSIYFWTNKLQQQQQEEEEVPSFGPWSFFTAPQPQTPRPWLQPRPRRPFERPVALRFQDLVAPGRMNPRPAATKGQTTCKVEGQVWRSKSGGEIWWDVQHLPVSLHIIYRYAYDFKMLLHGFAGRQCRWLQSIMVLFDSGAGGKLQGCRHPVS